MEACQVKLHQVVLVIVIAGLSVAFSSSPTHAGPADESKLDLTLLQHPTWVEDSAETIAVMLELEGPTALDVFLAGGHHVRAASPEAKVAAGDAFEAVAERQAPARAYIEDIGADIVSTYDTALNGYLVLADRSQIERLTHTPGLRRIYRAPEHYPQLGDAVPHIGAVEAAEQLGFDGSGVTIAIIDTGIDYTHKSFGGDGTQRAYTNNNPRTVEPNSFPTEKVVGGWDFAGSDYNPSRGQRDPSPDADPLDEQGHGSHVAGIAAGVEGNRRVHHGVARGAYLIGLKVFGRTGSTNIATDGLEWAIETNMMGQPQQGACEIPDSDCHIDIVNMSLGSPWALGIQESVGVMRRAVEAGIVVIASAGNSGDVPFIHGSPSGSVDAIAVANTYPPGEMGDAIEVTYDGTTELLEALEAAESLTKQIEEERGGELVGDLAWFGRACNGDQPEGDVAEKVALISRGTCPFRDKLGNAINAGAIAAVVHDDGSGLAGWGANPPNPVDMPGYMIAKEDGERLRQMLRDGSEIQVRMHEDYNGSLERHIDDVISPGSSRGPVRTGEFKPNISAPGTNILAPQRGGGDRGVSQSGTSMSGPMVAGAAAVVLQRLRADGLAPDGPLNDPELLTARDVGAMLMNYATATVWRRDSRVDDPVPLARQGAGRVEVFEAARGGTLLRAGPIASVTFGFQAIDDTFLEDVPVTLRNLTSDTKHYQVTTEMLMDDDEDAGVYYTVSDSELTVDGGQKQDFLLSAAAVSAEMKPFSGYGGQRALQESAIADAEMDAHLVVTEVDAEGEAIPDGDVARVPIYFHARQASSISVSPDPLRISPSSSEGQFSVRNEGGGPGRAELYSLIGEDPEESAVHPRLNIDFVGARTVAGPQGDRIVEFLVHTAGSRLLPLDSQAWVLIDADLDGEMDWLAQNYDLAFSRTGASLSGQQVLLREVTRNSPLQVSNQAALLPYFADMNMQSRTIVLPIPAERLGYDDADPISLAAVAWHQGVFPDSHGGAGYQTMDIIPDDGLATGGQGTSVGDGRIEFDAAALPYELESWSEQLAAGAAKTVAISKVSDGVEDERLLASFTTNPAGEGDLQVLDIVLSDATPEPTPTDEPEATATPTPELKGSVYMPIVYRRHAARIEP